MCRPAAPGRRTTASSRNSGRWSFEQQCAPSTSPSAVEGQRRRVHEHQDCSTRFGPHSAEAAAGRPASPRPTSHRLPSRFPWLLPVGDTLAHSQEREFSGSSAIHALDRQCGTGNCVTVATREERSSAMRVRQSCACKTSRLPKNAPMLLRALMRMRFCQPRPSWWPGASPPTHPDLTGGTAPGFRSGGRQVPRHSPGSHPACGTTSRDRPPRIACSGNRFRRYPCRPRSIARSPKPAALPNRCRPPCTGAATVGGVAGFCKAHGKEKSGDLPPFGPVRALLRDGAETALSIGRRQPARLVRGGPRPGQHDGEIPELGESCIPAACAFTAARGFEVRSLSDCLWGWKRSSGEV